MAKNEKLVKAMKGNKNGIVLKESEERIKAYTSYCDHIAKGFPKEAWFYRNGKFHCSWQTMEKYIKEDPDLEPFLMEKAQSESYKLWFEKGMNLVEGNVKRNSSPVVWQTIMRNMFKKQKWDQQELEPERRHEVHAEAIFNAWKGKAQEVSPHSSIDVEKY